MYFVKFSEKIFMEQDMYIFKSVNSLNELLKTTSLIFNEVVNCFIAKSKDLFGLEITILMKF